VSRQNRIRPARILLAALIISGSAFITEASAEPPPCRETSPQACQEQQEKRCRSAIESMLQIMRSTPLKTERDKNDVTELIARVEKMLSYNRSRGVEECRSWVDLNRIVAHQ
jgi:hypothetical protein